MSIKLLVIGKSDKGFVTAGEAEYLKRLRRFHKVEKIELADIKNARHLSASELKRLEGQKFLEVLQPNDILILLDENGKRWSSRAFAGQLQKWLNTTSGSIVLAIGGAYGFSDELKQKAHALLSLSDMTFSHQLIRVIFLEQLYRAFTILNNHPYHND
ncbi:MAG: 23S rRNA (pseudouridine(1915)-N(3))-methyltransferase RlmH [Saprospiraceae bacterium]|nr:23S rRNA (pseudouridine(1915)-N(3))-methyltransferase RlmH [Saprospiraceae bacterium]